MSEILKKFGRYFLLDHLAQGGMAEIYRARLVSPEAAGRIIVIKKIQSHFDSNSEFLQMFKSEIKVTMGFNHPNIVQVYDFGEEQGQPYIAMEMVDGKNLRQFMNRFIETKEQFPLELAIYIIEQAAAGLHYAHSFKDKITGEPLQIIHRDVSPQNILISFEGTVKVIDFGIAKANVNHEHTRAGVIKGKPSYLSPEQISGETIDGRSDLFALGIVLWELLTGKKLFAGENDLAVLKLIEAAQTHVKPPSQLNPKISKELDYIVLKTLAKSREKRYQTGEQLQRALHKFLYNYMPEFNPSDLSYYAKNLFKQEIVEDRKKIQRLNEKVEKLLSQAPPIPTELSPQPTTLQSPSLPVNPKTSSPSPSQKLPSLEEKKSKKNSTLTSIPPVHQKSSESENLIVGNEKKWVIPAFCFLLLLFLGGIRLHWIKLPSFLPIPRWLQGQVPQVTLEGQPTEAIVLINQKKVAERIPIDLFDLPVDQPLELLVTSDKGSFQKELTLKPNESQEISIEWESSENGKWASSHQKTIPLKLEWTPGGGNPRIKLNGSLISSEQPMTLAPLDIPLELTVERTGFKPFKRTFALISSTVETQKEIEMEVPLEPEHYGFLSLQSTPSAVASLFIEGDRPWTRKTPLESEKFPTGQYRILLKNETLGMEKEMNVKINEGVLTQISERLEAK